MSYHCGLRLTQEANQHGRGLRTGRATGRIKAGAGLAGNESFGHRPLYRLFCPSLHRATVLITVQVTAALDIPALILRKPEEHCRQLRTRHRSVPAALTGTMAASSNYAAFTRREVVVVFDGYRVPGGQGEKFDRSGLHVVFTRQGETADAYMEKLADEIGKNDSVRVVTSDALIQLTALRAGVLRMSAREFRQELAQVAQQLEAAIRDLNGR